MTRPNVVVGLTGGIGSGKSSVARLMEAHGALVVDADAIAREVVAPGSDGLTEIVAHFGDSVLAQDGTLNRAALGELAFASRASRRSLEAITHPRIAARTAELIAAAEPGQVVVHDIPLLVELDRADDYDLVVVVDAPAEVRVERLRGRGVAEDVARARMAAQATTEQRRAVADVWIDNDGDEAALRGQVDAVWRERIAPLRPGRTETSSDGE